MRLVIEGSDFQRLSQATQDELLRVLKGREVPPGAEVNGTPAPTRRPRFRWRRPVDLNSDLTSRLMHGLGENHKARLKLFAEKGGRVSLQQLLAVTGDSEPRALSHFEGAVTRRLRRILGDSEKVAYLIGWDYDSTQWNADRSEIVDGTYYVSDATLQRLRDYFELD